MTGEGRRPDQVPVRDAAEEAPRKARDGARVTRPDEAVACKVWVRARQTGEFEANGHAVEWTDRQVHVRYDDPHGRVGFGWFWASAVTRR